MKIHGEPTNCLRNWVMKYTWIRIYHMKNAKFIVKHHPVINAESLLLNYWHEIRFVTRITLKI